MNENNKIVKVNCNFCNGEMECPEDMFKQSKKHMCYKCFMSNEHFDVEEKEVHVDIPLDKLPEATASGMVSTLVADVFPDVWAEKKEELKEMSKKELAEEMFAEGVYCGVKAFMEGIKEVEDEDEKSK